MKRILVPTDFSRNALNAARYALDLYWEIPCEFYFMNVFHIGGYSIDTLRLPEASDPAYVAGKKESEDGLAKLLRMLGVHCDNPRHTYFTLSSYNSLVYAIKKTIEEKNIDIIVMGTKGITGAESILFGTNTIDVIEDIQECPVLAIPEKYSFTRPKEIVFPTDFKSTYARKEMNHLKEIVQLHNGSVRVLHIKTEKQLSLEQKAIKELLDIQLENTSHTFHELKDIKVHKGIGAFVESRSANLIAFINKKHGFFDKLLRKPLVKELGFHYNIPVLALNNDN
jgi:nucleotide-binding universal stress UspA family protein